MSLLLRRSLRAVSILVRCQSYAVSRALVNRPAVYNTQLHGPPLYRSMATIKEENIKNLTIDEVLKAAKEGVPVIDVREQIEIHNTGLIPGSINIPLGHLEDAMRMRPEEFKERYTIPKPEKDDRLIMSCQAGNRSKKAIVALQNMGYTNVYNNSVGWKGYEESQQNKTS